MDRNYGQEFLTYVFIDYENSYLKPNDGSGKTDRFTPSMSLSFEFLGNNKPE